MKLVSCYIENFGGLHQREFSFNEGLTVVEEPNGSGKTTLATFIRCMLYGMPRRVRDLGKDLRRRYEPWQGGSYGGQLTLHADGRTYRIERAFGSSPKEDTLAVYNTLTGRPTDDLGLVPGITLFGLDADSFERSAYLPQNHMLGALASSDIRSKLGNLVENTDGVHNYDSALKLLRSARAQRLSYRGESGAYYDLTAQISQVNDEMTQQTTAEGELQRVSARAERLEQTLDQQRQDLEQVRQDLMGAAGVVARRGLAVECKRLDDACKKAQEDYDRLAAPFAQGVPSDEELNRLFSAERSLELAKQSGIAGHEILKSIPGEDQERKDIPDASDAPKASRVPRASSPVYVVVIVLGVLLLLAGVAGVALELGGMVRLFTSQLYVSAAVGLAGLACCLGAGIARRRAPKGAHAAHAASKSSSELLQRYREAYDTQTSFCEAYGFDQQDITHEGLLQLWNSVQELRRAQQELATASRAFSDYVEEHGFCTWSREDEEHYRSLNVETLKQEERHLLDALEDALQSHARDLQRVQTLRERAESLPQLQERLQALTRQRNKASKDAATLDATMMFLSQAKDALSLNYTDSVQERFRYYLQLLLGSEMEETQIDSDFNVSYSQAGATRPLESLSAGYADLVVVCMRMALCDALYTKERPFIIMDDPFTNVDDELMPRSFQLLEKLCVDRQVLYFTCSNSRNPLK